MNDENTGTVSIDTEKLQNKLSELDSALHLTAEQVLSDIHAKQVVPHDTGALEDSGAVRKIKTNHYQIYFGAPYAKRLYYHPEYNFRTDKNPSARGRWMDSYVNGEDSNFIREAFIKNSKGRM